MTTDRVHIIGMARSGTTMLMSVLNEYMSPNQPQHLVSEPLGLKKRFPDSNFNYFTHISDDTKNMYNIVVSELEDYASSNSGEMTTKNLFWQYQKMEESEFSNRIDAIFNKIVVIVREDIIESVISLMIAKETQQWTQYESVDSIKIDEQEFLKFLKLYIDGYQMLYEFIREKQSVVTDIVYYDDIKDMNPLGIFKLMSFSDGYVLEDREHFLKPAPNKRTQLVNYDELYSLGVNTIQQINHKILYNGKIIRYEYWEKL